jgi:CheY-like chemotaxis protein
MKKILIIDDEKDFCYFVKRNLEITGRFDVTCSYDGTKGIETARQEKPDLILLDILMPGIDGGDVKVMLLNDEQTKKIPIVFLTAIMDKKEFGKEVVKEIRDHKFIAKPVTPEELITALDIVLAK